MQAVFLNNKTCERVHPVRIRKDNPDAEPFYEGMDEPLREIHDIWIMQYLRVDGAYFPRIAFEANEDENIEFDSNQEYEILSRKTDGYIYFIPENFNIYTVGDAQFFYRKNGKKQKIRIHVASMLDGETYEKILKELTAISIRFLYMTMNDGKNRRIKREYLTEYELEIHQLEHTIKEMSETLKALDREPVTDMISRPARQNFRQVKHLDANVIMDHYVLKKPKVRTRVHEKTFHIYENQKVYNFVKLLEKRLWALEQELEDKKMQMNRAAQGENRSRYNDVEENSGVAGTKKSIDELCSTITNLKGKLQAVYQLPMFKNEKYKEQKVYPLRTSNLFVNHKRYKKLFHQMRTYREMGELVEETVQYSSYHKSSEIYEIWCYFKILEIFILEKGYVIDRISWPGKKKKPFVFESWENQDYSKVVHAIKKYIENREKRDSVKILEELVIHITNGENDIYLGYNCTFQGKKASKAEVDEKGAVQYSTEQLRPDIFLILNKEIFFACDAKYKNYSKEFMGIQAWYTDLFECGAYKYIYRLNLGNVTDENSGKCMLPVKKKFVGEDSLKPVLKNGGVCILTPAISDSDMPSYYNGFEIEKKYETFLELLQEGKVNRDYRGCEILDSREYSCKLKEAICGEDGRESKYEYRIASTKFLPGNDRGFYNLFYEAFEYGQAHFLKAVF